jgi:hypothetical protein
VPLPAAVAKKAAAADALIARAGSPAAVRPTPEAKDAPAGDDVAALKQQLEALTADLKKANEQLSTLQGKYNAEVPRTAEQLRKKNEELAAAQRRVTELESASKKALENFELTGLSADDRRVAGEDIVRVATRIATEVANRTFDTRLGDVTKRIDILENMSDEGFFAVLLNEVPTWETINEEPEFLAWLQLRDAKTGRPRMDLIKRAEAGRQGYLMAEIFTAYLEKREIGAPQAADPKLPKRPGPEARLDAPAGGGEQVEAVEVDGKPIYTKAQINAHYHEKKVGRWKGREEAWRKIEVDMFAAQQEGRVRG